MPESQDLFNIVVFSSGGGGNFQSLIEHQVEYGYNISLLITDRECGALDRARKHQIKSLSFSKKGLGEKFFYDIDASIPLSTDLVVLAGFFPIIPDWFCSKWQNKIINTHPSLLPKFGGKGMYGVKVQEALLAANEKEAGCTVHFVDAGIDTGEIILQKSIPVVEGESAWDLGGRVFQEEVRLLPLAVKIIKDKLIGDRKSASEIVVSICCLVYNHSQYLDQCIKGFLNQETNFAFEILIHDDASTDGSADIIRKYQVKYPNVIKPIYQNQNQFSRGVSVSKTFQFPRAKGKYIAMCEGDDYWIDSQKLQKQVSFLESNPEYGLIHTDCNFYYQKKHRTLENVNQKTTLNFQFDEECSDIIGEAVLMGDYKVRTATALFKRELYYQSVDNDPDVFTSRYKMGDIQMWFGISKLSKIKYLDEVTAVYRINEGSVTQSKQRINQLRFQLSSIELRVYYISKYKFSNKFVSYISKEYNQRLLRYKIYDRSYKEIYPLFDDYMGLKEKLKLSIAKSSLLCRIYTMIISFTIY